MKVTRRKKLFGGSMADAGNVTQDVMNKVATTLPEALAKIIDKSINAIDAGVNFLSEQIPDVIHQLLLYNLVWSLMWWIVGLIGMIISIVTVFYVCKSEKWTGDETGAACMAMFFLFMVSMVTFASHWEWLQIWLAPKIYLIEYATHLYKSMSSK
ncbi:hypothetical protein RsoM2USA_390 [Ralstonia phage RsoM2USA]|nr:hypothetical protein RsoM2USA_390 [Ralstonia phage RsoM2USA]